MKNTGVQYPKNCRKAYARYSGYPRTFRTLRSRTLYWTCFFATVRTRISDTPASPNTSVRNPRNRSAHAIELASMIAWQTDDRMTALIPLPD